MLITTCLKPISTEADYQEALARVEAIFEARPGTPESNELGILGPLVCDYEAQHYPMPEPAAKHLLPSPSPLDIIKVALLVTAGTLVSCRIQQPVQIINYQQVRELSTKWALHYKAHKKQAYWVGPPLRYTSMSRKNPTQKAIFTGHVDVMEENGKSTFLPGALVAFDEIHTETDRSGNFLLEVPAGRHSLKVGGIGLLWSEAPPLRVRQGDSIKIQVSLLPDLRPLID